MRFAKSLKLFDSFCLIENCLLDYQTEITYYFNYLLLPIIICCDRNLLKIFKPKPLNAKANPKFINI